MLNSRFFGSGLNLENSTDIILYHSMTPEITKQVIGRAQRPGRTQPLNIWNLRYSDEWVNKLSIIIVKIIITLTL